MRRNGRFEDWVSSIAGILATNKYIVYWRRHKLYEHEKGTIGLIISRKAGREEVIYARASVEKRILVVEYAVKLPSEAKIKEP